MRRWAFAPVSLAIALAIRAATPILIAQSPGTDPVIELTGATDGVRERMTAAARLATSRFNEWLGPPPFDRISIGGGAPRPADSPGQMRVEALVAEELARAWLARINGHDQWKEGVVTYLQSRVVEEMFDRTFLLRAYRYDGDCFFGCLVSWSFRGLP
ncbi:MAG TPA: hypothetical protein VM096_04095, partial [Vicinamibacterales bacterium]|nr:hypothetical protein [Vicinamibacterales bacterium]